MALRFTVQKLKNNKLRFEENIKKNRLEYDEGSSRENGVTFHVRSLTMERGIFRCFGHAKPMSRKKTEAEVIGDILEDDDEEVEEEVEEEEEMNMDFIRQGTCLQGGSARNVKNVARQRLEASAVRTVQEWAPATGMMSASGLVLGWDWDHIGYELYR